MRKKMSATEKRSVMIGVKVQPEIKEKLKYLAKREDKQLSTFINEILLKEIEETFKHAKIDWDKLSAEERNY